MRISDWSSDVCSSDLPPARRHGDAGHLAVVAGEDVQQPAAVLEVPQPQRAVVAGRKRLAPLVEEGAGVHRPLVVIQHLDGLLAFEVPQNEAVVEAGGDGPAAVRGPGRSEAHTSELQSLMRISYGVFGWK